MKRVVFLLCVVLLVGCVGTAKFPQASEKVVKETVIVEKEVTRIVEKPIVKILGKVVKETVVVEKEVTRVVKKEVEREVTRIVEVPVEKVVKETVVVEKEVEVTRVVEKSVTITPSPTPATPVVSVGPYENVLLMKGTSYHLGNVLVGYDLVTLSGFIDTLRGAGFSVHVLDGEVKPQTLSQYGVIVYHLGDLNENEVGLIRE